MALELDVYRQIRQLYQAVGLSQRQIAKKLSLSRGTVAKYCQGMVDPLEHKKPQRQAPLFDKARPVILQLLQENKTLPRKIKWNASTIWQYLATVPRLRPNCLAIWRWLRPTAW